MFVNFHVGEVEDEIVIPIEVYSKEKRDFGRYDINRAANNRADCSGKAQFNRTQAMLIAVSEAESTPGRAGLEGPYRCAAVGLSLG